MSIHSGLTSGLSSGLRSGLNPSSEVDDTTTLTVSITDSADPVITAAPYSYTVTVTNTGEDNDATNVTCLVTLDAQLTFVSASGDGWTCDHAAGVVTCTRATLAADTTAPAITVNVTSPAAAETSSTTADVEADNADPADQDTETTVCNLVAKDATSGIRVPASSTQWTNFLAFHGLSAAVPDHLFLLQEASGNVADSIGSLTLTANGTPAYQQSLTGWTRTGVQGDGATTSQRFRNTSFVDGSTVSTMVLAFVQLNTLDTTARNVFSVGASGDTSCEALVSTNNRYRYHEQANSATATTNHTNAVRPVLMQINVTATTARLYTDLEKLSPTYGAPSAAAPWFTIGAATGTWAASTIGYCAVWTGADAELSEANIKALLQAMGWTIPW